MCLRAERPCCSWEGRSEADSEIEGKGGVLDPCTGNNAPLSLSVSACAVTAAVICDQTSNLERTQRNQFFPRHVNTTQNLQNAPGVSLDRWSNATSQRMQHSSAPPLLVFLLSRCSSCASPLLLEFRISKLHALSIACGSSRAGCS